MTHTITSFVTHHGYLAVFVLMVLESACIPVPSEAILLFAGAVAGGAFADRGDPHLNWVVVAVVGIAGNLVGSLVAYAVGRYGGRTLVEHRALSWLIRPHHLDRADRFFARRGALAVGVGRVLPVIRTFISLPAGLAEMAVGPFVVFTIVGCIPWIFGLSAAGYGIGDNWESVSHDFTPISIAIAVLLVAGLVVWWVRNRGSEDDPRPVAEDTR